jgi:hypothetical protein
MSEPTAEQTEKAMMYFMKSYNSHVGGHCECTCAGILAAHAYLQSVQEYPHHVLCSGDRKFPAGVPGHSCSCFELKPAPEPMTGDVVERMCRAYDDCQECKPSYHYSSMTAAARVCQADHDARWKKAIIEESYNYSDPTREMGREYIDRVRNRMRKSAPTMQERVAALLGGDTKKAAEIDALYREGKCLAL